MAEVTLPKFEIVPTTMDGLDLEGNPARYDVRLCNVTCEEVRAALQQVAKAYPELADVMKVAIAMQVRLDTIRDETKLQLYAIQHGAEKEGAAQTVEKIKHLRAWLGQRGAVHSLHV